MLRDVLNLDFASRLEDHNSWWIKRAQSSAENDVHFEEDKLQLNLQPNDHNVLECRGRIEGEYPIYLLDNHLYTHKLVERTRLSTLHGGVAITMSKVREIHWVPRLRQLVENIRAGCWGCKRHRARAYESPPPGNLSITRTQESTPFQVLGVDFAGPIRYQTKGKTNRKPIFGTVRVQLNKSSSPGASEVFGSRGIMMNSL